MLQIHTNRCRARLCLQTEVYILFCYLIYIAVCIRIETETPRGPARSQGKSGLSGTIAQGRRKGLSAFWIQWVDTSREKKEKNKKTSKNLFLLFTDCFPPDLLRFLLLLSTNSFFSPPDPHRKLLPGGCCTRNSAQAFDPVPDHLLKACHFSFRPQSIPRRLFISKH